MKIPSHIILLTAFCAAGAQAGEASLEDLEGKAGYAIGWQTMNTLQSDGTELDYDALLAGLEDAHAGKAAQLSATEMRNGMDYFTTLKTLNRQARLDKIKKDGKAFLEQNREQAGVTALASGLQYQVLQSGDASAPGPGADDGVRIRYLINDIEGKELGKSPDDPTHAVLMNALIPGWKEALLLMKPGDRWRLFLPPELAYGEKPANSQLKPNQTLVTELELVAVASADEMKFQEQLHAQARAEPRPATVVPGSQFSFSK
ncbi:MAG: FKBP-type peptidyl-prolyl cis-trans isomerase N-terminal domain-containing protein [Methylococcales bacterium]|nr:FKBP-type peptidyl-prolyl cis-trans isomerase N-terminal domain-containing protein [Methylococcales bacterium]